MGARSGVVRHRQGKGQNHQKVRSTGRQAEVGVQCREGGVCGGACLQKVEAGRQKVERDVQRGMARAAVGTEGAEGRGKEEAGREESGKGEGGEKGKEEGE